MLVLENAIAYNHENQGKYVILVLLYLLSLSLLLLLLLKKKVFVIDFSPPVNMFDFFHHLLLTYLHLLCSSPPFFSPFLSRTHILFPPISLSSFSPPLIFLSHPLTPTPTLPLTLHLSLPHPTPPSLSAVNASAQKLSIVFEQLFLEVVLSWDNPLPFNDSCRACRAHESVADAKWVQCERYVRTCLCLFDRLFVC